MTGRVLGLVGTGRIGVMHARSIAARAQESGFASMTFCELFPRTTARGCTELLLIAADHPGRRARSAGRAPGPRQRQISTPPADGDVAATVDRAVGLL